MRKRECLLARAIRAARPGSEQRVEALLIGGVVMLELGLKDAAARRTRRGCGQSPRLSDLHPEEEA